MRILLVSPFRAERSALQQLLTEDGHDVVTATTPAGGIELATSHHPDVVIADAQVAELEGRALARAFGDRGLRPRVILLCPRAGKCVGTECLTKPIDLELLRRCLAAPRACDCRVA